MRVEQVFGAGEVEQILDIDSWRLQKFVSGKTYRLKPEEQIGKGGQGSRRVFRIEDVYRIGIANFLVRDGFSAKHVSEVLQWIEDQDLISFDEKGRVEPPTIGFVRAEKPEFRETSASETPKATANSGAIYYALPLDQIIEGIDEQVRKWKRGDRGWI